MRKQILLAFYVFVVVIILVSCAPTGSESHIVRNPDSTLQVEIQSNEYKKDWKTLDSDTNSRLRLSYAPNRNMSEEIIITFALLELESSLNLPLLEFSKDIQDMIVENYIGNNGLKLLSEEVVPQETKINDYNAVQYDNLFSGIEAGQELHLSVIVAEGEKHYIQIIILCGKENYSGDREKAFWKVLESIKEINF